MKNVLRKFGCYCWWMKSVLPKNMLIIEKIERFCKLKWYDFYISACGLQIVYL